MEENEANLEACNVPSDLSHGINWAFSQFTSQQPAKWSPNISDQRAGMFSPYMESSTRRNNVQLLSPGSSMATLSAPFPLDNASEYHLPLQDPQMLFAQPVHPIASLNNLQSSGMPAYPGDTQQHVPWTEPFVDTAKITQSSPLPKISSDGNTIMPPDPVMPSDAMPSSPMHPASQISYHPDLTFGVDSNPQATKNKVLPCSSFADRRSSIPAALFCLSPSSPPYSSQHPSSASLMTPTPASFISEQSPSLSWQSSSEHMHSASVDEYRELRRHQSYNILLDKVIIPQSSPGPSAYASLPTSASHIPPSHIAQPPLHSSLSSPTASVRKTSSSSSLLSNDEGSYSTSTFRIRTNETKEAAPACDFCRRRKVRGDRIQPTCTFCTKHGIQCTTSDQLRKRGPPTKKQRAEMEQAGLRYDRGKRRLVVVDYQKTSGTSASSSQTPSRESSDFDKDESD